VPCRSVRGDTNGLTEVVFITGLTGLGVISLGAGFISSKIPMIICRALIGIGEYLHLCLDSGLWLMVAFQLLR
jgi:hypothetical protein